MFQHSLLPSVREASSVHPISVRELFAGDVEAFPPVVALSLGNSRVLGPALVAQWGFCASRLQHGYQRGLGKGL